jgi:CheY-like chemotaxis protein
MVREALAHHGIDSELSCHKDGEQMLRYIDQIDAGELPCPDVILLDLNLPRHDGVALLTRLRRSPVCADVPVVVVTSSRADTDRDKAFQLGATKYFEKPIDYDDFLRLGAVVREVVLGKSGS